MFTDYRRAVLRVFACRCCVSGLEARVSDFADEGDSEVQRCRVEAASDNFGIEATQDFTFRLAGKSSHLSSTGFAIATAITNNKITDV